MSSQLPKTQLDGYWQALSANARVQTLEGQGTQPKFEAAPVLSAKPSPKRGFDYNL